MRWTICSLASGPSASFSRGLSGWPAWFLGFVVTPLLASCALLGLEKRRPSISLIIPTPAIESGVSDLRHPSGKLLVSVHVESGLRQSRYDARRRAYRCGASGADVLLIQKVHFEQNLRLALARALTRRNVRVTRGGVPSHYALAVRVDDLYFDGKTLRLAVTLASSTPKKHIYRRRLEFLISVIGATKRPNGWQKHFNDVLGRLCDDLSDSFVLGLTKRRQSDRGALRGYVGTVGYRWRKVVDGGWKRAPRRAKNQTLTNKALRLLIKRRHREASQLLRKHVARHPQDPRGRFLLGMLLISQGRYSAARKHLSIGHDLGGRGPRSRFGIALASRLLLRRRLSRDAPSQADRQSVTQATQRFFSAVSRGSALDLLKAFELPLYFKLVGLVPKSKRELLASLQLVLAAYTIRPMRKAASQVRVKRVTIHGDGNIGLVELAASNPRIPKYAIATKRSGAWRIACWPLGICFGAAPGATGKTRRKRERR